MTTTEKLNQFPKEFQDRISSKGFLRGIGELEEKYNVKLLSKFIKLVVGDLQIEKLESNLVEDGASRATAKMISQRLYEIISSLKLQFPEAFKKMNSDGIRISNINNRKTQSGERTGSHFSVEDEEEIAGYKKQPIAGGNSLDYDSAVSNIMEELNYQIGDDVLQKRLASIILSRLKDIRDEMETVEILERSKKIGGMEMAKDRIASLMAIVKTHIERGIAEKTGDDDKNVFTFHDMREKLEADNKTESGASDVAPVKINSNEDKVTITEEDGLPVINMSNPKKQVPSNGLSTKIQPVPQPVSPPIKRVLNNRIANNKSKKPKLADVQYSSNAVGPIEELELMTLIDFRRLAATPDAITAKVAEKIKLLEEDSYAKKMEGIEAWHRNEVNKFYRLLGQESLKEGKSVEDIINDRLADNKPTLSFDEFNAIMKLNGGLRF